MTQKPTEEKECEHKFKTDKECIFSDCGMRIYWITIFCEKCGKIIKEGKTTL